MHLKFLPLQTLLVAILCTSALALRCGGELVEMGDPRTVVLSKCGEPDDTMISTKEIEIGNVTRTLIVETWVYNLGPQDFLYFLVFENGRLIDVNTGGYGY